MLSLLEKIKDPGNTFAEPPTLVLTDLIHFGSELQQHVALLAVLKFVSEQAFILPRLNSSEDVAKVVQYAKEIVENKEVVIDSFELDVEFVTR
jgi:hypothetical protein